MPQQRQPSPRSKVLLNDFIDKGRILKSPSSSPDRRYEASWDEEEHLLIITFINRGYGRQTYAYLVDETAPRSYYFAPSKGKWVWTRLRVRGSRTAHQVPFWKMS